jgi:hypothetical protein
MSVDDKVNKLIDLAIVYAESRRLDVDEYIGGLFSFNEEKDPELLLDTLIRYHKDWLK